jgi:hypothetical protein
MLPIDFGSLSPAQKMDLADVLYDAAQQEMEAEANAFTSAQLKEVNRRFARADRQGDTGQPWPEVRDRLLASCK